MRRLLRTLAGIGLAAVVTGALVTAQGAPAGQAPAPQGAPGGRGGGPAAPPARIDLATAKKALAAAEAAAASLNIRVAIAVVDANGDLVAFTRMDGATARAVTSSEGKARAAILFGLPTKQVQDAIAANQPLTVTVTNPAGGAFEITPFQGAIPILKDGKVVAAVGAGGAAPAMDEQVAMAGANAIR